MFYIQEIVASPQQEEHVWTKHRITLEEVEEVCFSRPFVVRGRDGSYAIYGQTAAGRYLVVFLYPSDGDVYSLATAREMQSSERRRYRKSRR